MNKRENLEKQSRYRPGHIELIQTGSGPCWYFRYQETVAGKSIRRRIRIGLQSEYPTKTAAMRAASSIREEVNAPPGERAARERLFEDVIARYEREEMPERKDTARNYRRWIKGYIRPAWGDKRLTEVKASRVRVWIKGLELSGRSKGHIHGMMKTLFRFAMLWEWMPTAENPMSLFHIEGSSKREEEPRVISMEEFYAVVDVLKEPFRTMFIGAAALGLRCSELFALKWSDFDFHAKKVRIERGFVEGHVDDVKTRHSKKKLPLDEDLAQIFLAFRTRSEFKAETDWVFASPQMAGAQPYYPNNLQYRILRPAGKAAGLDFNLGWHTLRHSYRSWLDERGVELTVQRDLMRHADIRMTSDYGDVSIDRLRQPNSEVVKQLLRRPQ